MANTILVEANIILRICSQICNIIKFYCYSYCIIVVQQHFISGLFLQLPACKYIPATGNFWVLQLHKAIWDETGPKHFTAVSLQISTTDCMWGNHQLCKCNYGQEIPYRTCHIPQLWNALSGTLSQILWCVVFGDIPYGLQPMTNTSQIVLPLSQLSLRGLHQVRLKGLVSRVNVLFTLSTSH